MNAVINAPKSIINYLREVLAELKAMEWLPASKVAQFTIVVLFLTIAVVMLVAGFDAVWVSLRSLLLNRF